MTIQRRDQAYGCSGSSPGRLLAYGWVQGLERTPETSIQIKQRFVGSQSFVRAQCGAQSSLLQKIFSQASKSDSSGKSLPQESHHREENFAIRKVWRNDVVHFVALNRPLGVSKLNRFHSPRSNLNSI